LELQRSLDERSQTSDNPEHELTITDEDVGEEAVFEDGENLQVEINESEASSLAVAR
jgi:hypothetical protein